MGRFLCGWILLWIQCFGVVVAEAASHNHNNHHHHHGGPNHLNKLPEVPSTLLKLHRIYSSQPPHDTALYNTLRVSPNCTAADIQKSYRKLSRIWHPDKQRHRHQPDDDREQQQYCQQELEKIQQAHEILSNDATRVPYHKYGLLDLSTAVQILTGYQHTPKIPPPSQMELMHLMGFHQFGAGSGSTSRSTSHAGLKPPSPAFVSMPPRPPPPPPPPPPRRTHHRPLKQESHSYYTSSSTTQQQQQHATTVGSLLSFEEQQKRRVWYLAATILESIRPLVEGRVSEATLANFVSEQCDRIKKLPLGAQIIRCVGRAYRHAGKRYLRRYHHHHRHNKHNHNNNHNNAPWSIASDNNKKHKLLLLRLPVMEEPIRDRWHDAKHFWTAAMASGKVAWKEKIASKRFKMDHKNKKASIAYYNNNWDSDNEEETICKMFDDEKMEEEDDFFVIDECSNSEDDDDDEEEDASFLATTNEELQLDEAQKAQKVLIDLLQVEALWKVHKIGLDRVVRAACDLILSGRYFFFPSHQTNQPPSNSYLLGTPAGSSCDWQQQQQQHAGDGWVSAAASTSTTSGGSRYHSAEGQAINADVGRLRAAQALVLVGDVMVQCSKQGTSWME